MIAPRNAAMTTPVGSRVPRDRAKNAWPMVRLGEVCDFVRRGKSPVYCETSQFPMFAQKCNQPSGIVLDKCKFCEPEKYFKFADEYRLRENDIVVNSTGTGTLGRVGLFREEFLRPYGFESIVADSHVMIVRTNEKIVSLYLYLYMKQGWVYQWINDNANGSTNQKELYPQTLVELPVPLPPLSVQRDIVARLEKELGEADRLAAKFKRVAELADDAFKAELDETFKKLEKECDSRVEHVERVEGTSDGLAAKNAKRAKTRRVRLGDVCEIERGKSKMRPRNAPELYGGTYPFIQTGDIKNASGGVIQKYTQTYSEIGLQQSKLWNRGVLCMTIAANIGEAAILGFDACFPDSIVGIIPHKEIDVFFLNYYFCAIKKHLSEIAPGTAQKNFNIERLSSIEFLQPPLPAQRAIVAKLDAAKERCEKLKAAALRGLAAAENLRKAILAEAFEQ